MAAPSGKGSNMPGPSPTSHYNEVPDVVVTDGFNAEDGPLPTTPDLGADEEVPPAYSEFHDQLNLHQPGFDAGATLGDDGRININISQVGRQLTDIIAPSLQQEADLAAQNPLPPPYIPPSLGGAPGQQPPPRLNIVIQIVGSRGDVQPFVALGQVLKETYGHRVRVATHGTFQKFVEDNGLEFFSIGGDPAELMAFMVKNPGLMPGVDALKNGEVTKRRRGIEEILLGCWRSCIEAGDGSGPAPRFPRKDRKNKGREPTSPPIPSPSLDGTPIAKPFVADAIIANPPSFAHIHVAEKLGIPLHLMFTMPWSPTRAFPQPLANIQSSNTDPVTTNYVSYTLVEMMTWQGLGDIINRFRTKILDLEPLSLLWAPAVLTRLRIPHTYCWSPALIPKPNDWGQHIDIAGFYFLNLASNYTPEPDLAAFLAAGPPPVYIGFGSIVVDDPNGLTRMIFDAVAATGVRALVSKGWGGLGADDVGLPDGVFMLGNCPHDWLFEHVSAVCHHGGAGTTAAGIKAGKPTIVVPFFGDQPFWGSMVARAGAGPDPIPYKKLTTEGLAEAIRIAIKPETQTRATELGEKIREEQGCQLGAQSFHKHLDPDILRCSLVPSRAAVWRVRRTQTRLSPLAASALVQLGYLQYSDLKLFRAKEYSTEDQPTDPVTAVTSALIGDIGSIGMSVADFPRQLFKSRPKSQETGEQGTDGNVTEQNNASTTSLGTNVGNQADSSKGQGASDTASLPSHAPTSTTATESTRDLSIVSSAQPSSTDQSSAPQGSNGSKSKSPKMTTEDMMRPENIERAIQAGKSIENIVSTGMKTPMNFCLGMARGFRNAPRLYNDETIRPTEKVTSLGSGLRVAGKEFGLGVFDGITGLVTQPVRGAAKEGASGAAKGFGKGVGGLIFKNAAAMWAIPAYTMAGVHAEIRSMFAQSALNYIIASRISQGNEDYSQSCAEEVQGIESRWLAEAPRMKGYYHWKQKEKGKSKDSISAPKQVSTAPTASTESPKTGWKYTKNLPFEERKRLHDLKDTWKKVRAGKLDPATARNVLASGFTESYGGPREENEEMERAIQASVRQTSNGDATEDARIESAIRSSIAAMRTRSSTVGSFSSSSSAGGAPPAYGSQGGGFVDEKRLDRDIQKMISESGQTPPSNMEDITDEEYQSLIEKAVQLSITENAKRSSQRGYSSDSDDGEYQRALEMSQADQGRKTQTNVDGQNEEDEDEAFRRAIEASQAEQHQVQNSQDPDADEEMRRAIEESEKAHKEELQRSSTMKSEEDIVMEYVKRQSLAEVEFRRQMGYPQGPGGDGQGDEMDEDEALRRAIEESNKSSGAGSSSRP